MTAGIGVDLSDIIKKAHKLAVSGKSVLLPRIFPSRYGGAMEPRLPRFQRATVADIQLTERDREIIRLVHRHRFLRSSQIVALMGGSSQQLVRRLQLLFHQGYLERPRAQLDYYHQGGSRYIVYGLGNNGATLLRQELGSAFWPLLWGEKNRSVGRVYLEHALLVSEVLVAVELACRKANIRLVTEGELKLERDDGAGCQAFRWRVNLTNGMKLGIRPDRVFALEFPGSDGNPTRSYFFLEADRGTMPVTRHTLSQTSFFRKLLAYEATWTQGLHQSKFGFHRFRVLTVTKSAARVKSLVEVCAQLERGHGLFLFADRTILEKPEDIFSAVFQTGRQGETTKLLD